MVGHIYQVSDLFDLAHSPLVKRPEGMQLIDEAVTRAREQHRQQYESGGSMANNSKQRSRNRVGQSQHGWHDNNASGNRRLNNGGGLHGRQNFRGYSSDLPDGEDTEETIDWLDPTDDSQSTIFTNNDSSVAEFEKWKQTKKIEALQRAGFTDVEAAAQVASEAAAAFHNDAPEAQTQPKTTLDFWDATSTTSSQPTPAAGGASKFSSFFGPANGKSTPVQQPQPGQHLPQGQPTQQTQQNPLYQQYQQRQVPQQFQQYPQPHQMVPVMNGANGMPGMQPNGLSGHTNFPVPGPPPGLSGPILPPGSNGPGALSGDITGGPGSHIGLPGPPPGLRSKGINGAPGFGLPPGFTGPPSQGPIPTPPPGLGIPTGVPPPGLQKRSVQTAPTQKGKDDAFFNSLLSKGAPPS